SKTQEWAFRFTSVGLRTGFPSKQRDFRHVGNGGPLAVDRMGRSGMALRLRYQIESPGHLREHVHLVDGSDGAGYFFFAGAVAPKGTLASLEVDFTGSAQVALFRGWVWARSHGAGLWLELAGAQRCLPKLEESPARCGVRLATD